MLISLKQNGLTAGATSMDCISPLPSEMSGAAVQWCKDLREGRGISTKISEFFLNQTFFKNKRIIKELSSDIYFTKKMYPNIRILCPLGR